MKASHCCARTSQPTYVLYAERPRPAFINAAPLLAALAAGGRSARCACMSWTAQQLASQTQQLHTATAAAAAAVSAELLWRPAAAVRALLEV
jgi:hypothetical protein